MLLVIIGEFFAAPAITLADSAVLTLLGEDADTYSHQRMFGSFGWGLAMFFVGKNLFFLDADKKSLSLFENKYFNNLY